MAKVMVSLPDNVLEAVDAERNNRSMTRSAFLALAARRELERRDPDRIAAVIARSQRRFENSPSFESADLVRRDRDANR